jgi:hypothetical protein
MKNFANRRFRYVFINVFQKLFHVLSYKMVCIHGKINDKSIHYGPNLYSLLYSKKNVLLCLPVLPVQFSIKTGSDTKQP